jgi:putative toxin-antitoxin system antitoxin component (TIGR02293 family)
MRHLAYNHCHLAETQDGQVKAYASTLAVLGVQAREQQPGYKARRRGSGQLSEVAPLIEVQDGTVPFTAIATLARALGVEPREVQDVTGMTARTAARRNTEGALKAEEADRLLRVARVLEEAMRVFGSREKAATWLRTESALLGEAPFRLLASDAGAKAVSDELIRIDFGDFA